MDLSTAKKLAIETMAKHGLIDWRFSFTKSQRSFGTCSYNYREITLSAPLVMVNDEKRVMNTILHEIAHALTPKHNHDAVWVAKAREIGCTGQKCWKPVRFGGDTVEVKRWLRTCPKCAHEVECVGKGSRYTYCRECGHHVVRSTDEKFKWSQSEVFKAVNKIDTVKITERVADYMESQRKLELYMELSNQKTCLVLPTRLIEAISNL
jgi:ribosomal protein S27E